MEGVFLIYGVRVRGVVCGVPGADYGVRGAGCGVQSVDCGCEI